MILMNLGVTGHRLDRLYGQSYLMDKWCKTQIINYKPTLCLNGMAGGSDQLFAFMLSYQTIIPYGVFSHIEKILNI